MNDYRIPKLCLRRLLLNRHTKDINYDWIAQLDSILSQARIYVDWDYLSPGLLQTQISQYVELYQISCPSGILSDQKTLNSVYSINLSSLEYCMLKNTLCLICHFFCKRTLVQIRLASTHIIKVSTNNQIPIIDPKQYCTLYNLLEREGLYHTFIKCPFYAPMKNHYLSELLIRSDNEHNELIKLFRSQDYKMVKNIAFFCK